MDSVTPSARGIRWWPAVIIVVVAAGLAGFFQTQDHLPFQLRNMRSMGTGLIATLLLVLWWLGFSRTPWRQRLGIFALVTAGIAGFLYAFPIKGVSGDLIPIFEARWRRGQARATPAPQASAQTTTNLTSTNTAPPAAAEVSKPNAGSERSDYAQFLGPERTGVLARLELETDWAAHPPTLLWRQPVGSAWSGFIIVGDRALTQEQLGEDECVTCREASTGRLLWTHKDATRYATTIAGEGPRATPLVVGDRVFSLGANGRLNCLLLATGERVWTHDLITEAEVRVPDWGFSGSPLWLDGLIVVSAGGAKGKSLLAYRATDGTLAWSAGDDGAGYGSPVIATLAGVRQVLLFNQHRITAHATEGGRVLWEYPWGSGKPHVATPVITGPDTVVFSSGYGVGSEQLRVSTGTNGTWEVKSVWASKRMKSKFATLVARAGYLYGLDDGMLACVDLREGALRWKEGRYGHGQGLWVGSTYLLMAESGELVLLEPTPEAPNERQRSRVFESKTWNPIALAGDLLIVRNDVEAAAFRLALATAQKR